MMSVGGSVSVSQESGWTLESVPPLGLGRGRNIEFQLPAPGAGSLWKITEKVKVVTYGK